MNFFRQTNYKIEVPVPPPYEGLKKKYAKEISWENIKLNHNLNDRYIPPYVGLSYELIHEIENGESTSPASTSTSGQCDAPKTDANNVDNSATGSTPSNNGSSESPGSTGNDVAVIPDGNSTPSNTGGAVDGTSTPNDNGSVPPVISATDGPSDVSNPNGGNVDSNATTTTPSTNGSSETPDSSGSGNGAVTTEGGGATPSNDSVPPVSTPNDNSNVTPGTTDINTPGTSDTNTPSPSINESEIPKSTEKWPSEPGTEAVVPNEEKPIMEPVPNDGVTPEVVGENAPSGNGSENLESNMVATLP